jgi:hypothetical protein
MTGYIFWGVIAFFAIGAMGEKSAITIFTLIFGYLAWHHMGIF